MSSEQQEWTPERIAGFYAGGELQEKQLCEAINAALAAERQRREQAENELRDLKCQHENMAIELAKALKQ